MSTHDKQSPVMLDDLLAEGELTLAELARIIGGADLFAPLPQTTDAQFNTGTMSVPNSPAPFTTNFNFIGDVKVQSSTDSSYSSFLGATGSSGNENSVGAPQPIVMNLTNKFP